MLRRLRLPPDNRGMTCLTFPRCAALSAAFLCSAVLAAASVNDRLDTTASFFENAEEGWFWYRDTQPESPEDDSLQSPVDPPPGPPAFSVAWLRENLPRYRDLAIDDPSPKNIRAFLFVQRIMLDKAENFAQAMQQQVVGDALVDESARRSLATFGTHRIGAAAEAGKTSALKSLSEKVGLFFFYRSDCPYCKAQVPVLEVFRNTYDIAVMGVAMDGKAAQLPFDWKPDNGAAEKMGIMDVPALVVVTPAGEASQISQGLVALTEIERRVLIAAKRKGWISTSDYDATRPLTHPEMNNLAAALMPKSDTARQKLASFQEADGFISPDKLIPLVTLRAKVTNTSLSVAPAAAAGSELVETMKKAAELRTSEGQAE